MKASRSCNVIAQLEPYTDILDLKFFAAATAFALVFATTVVGKAVGMAVC